MSAEVAASASRAIADHVIEHKLSKVSVVFHGGEPLLVGAERLDQYCSIISSTIPAEVEFAVQSNGTLLDEKILQVLSKFHVKVGLSLDGNETANDRGRPFRNGRGSYSRAITGLKLLRSRPEWARLFGGILAVIDLRNEPEDVYEALDILGIKSFDLLLPDHHHDNPPARPADESGPIAYGLWLSRFFDLWLEGKNEIEIRYFEELICMLLGGESSLEAIGAKTVDLIVVETDGDIEAVDTLKMIGRDATYLGLNVANNSFDEALERPAVYSRMLGYGALCEKCKSCPELSQCGGGYLPHRFGRGNGFLNESIYCDDIQYLIGHIRSRLRSALPTSAKSELNYA
jgi:uncharacterized protein